MTPDVLFCGSENWLGIARVAAGFTRGSFFGALTVSGVHAAQPREGRARDADAQRPLTPPPRGRTVRKDRESDSRSEGIVVACIARRPAEAGLQFIEAVGVTGSRPPRRTRDNNMWFDLEDMWQAPGALPYIVFGIVVAFLML